MKKFYRSMTLIVIAGMLAAYGYVQAAPQAARARLVAGREAAVVHALVADHLLQELHGFARQRVVHDFGVLRVR